MCVSQTPDENILPKWAQRVAKSKIRRLYELDAKGIYDEDLLNDVIQFLDALSYGSASTPGIIRNQSEWFEKSQNARDWVRK